MLRCRDVTEIVGTDAIHSASWRTRLQVRAHLLMCRHCRAYVRGLRRVAELAREVIAPAPPPPDPRDDAVIAAVLRASSSKSSRDPTLPDT